MKVRMTVQVSGTRSGVDWPALGEVLETDAVEGAQLCQAGLAAPVVEDAVETAVPPKAEERTAAEDKSVPAKRTRS